MCFSGPLPDPEALARYNQIIPDAAERIIKMAENEATSRRGNERMSVIHSIVITYLGMIFGFISVLIISALVWYSIYKSYEKTAAAIAVGCIAAVAGVFVFFKRNAKRKLPDE